MSRASHPIQQKAHVDDPFSVDCLAQIFRFAPARVDRLISRESTTLEFKESFGWKSLPDYARTMAAFANNKGGYLVFGVTDNPHLLKGLQKTFFEELDPQQLTSKLNEMLQPALNWLAFLYDYDVLNMKFGLIYTFQAQNKPVIAIRNYGDVITGGEIYYRYSGQSLRIRYAELIGILEERRQKDYADWMRYLSKIAQVGVQNAAILDTVNGEIDAPSGARFVIDESLLSKLRVIREGYFDEKTGAPVLKLIGDLVAIPSPVIRPTKKVSLPVPLHTPDIIHTFLSRSQVNEPQNYIKQLCFEASCYLPIYYFIHQAGMSVEQAIELLGEVTARGQTKERLIRRLRSGGDLTMRIVNTGSYAAGRRIMFYEQIKAQSFGIEAVDRSDLRYACQAFRGLTRGETDFDYLAPILCNLFDEYYSNSGLVDQVAGDELRRAICHLDWLLYKE